MEGARDRINHLSIFIDMKIRRYIFMFDDDNQPFHGLLVGGLKNESGRDILYFWFVFEEFEK